MSEYLIDLQGEVLALSGLSSGPTDYKSVGLTHKLTNGLKVKLANVAARVAVINTFSLFLTQ